MNRRKPTPIRKGLAALLVLASICLTIGSVVADPCGMVPPIQVRTDPSLLVRTGLQRTYVFYNEKTGIENFIVRPAFVGKIGDFGMLIPFPSIPAIRKVPDDIFSQIAQAIDPPVVNIQVGPVFRGRLSRRFDGKSAEVDKLSLSQEDSRAQFVRLVKQEAVGMYQVAVLEAGSPEALARWMKDNGYVYPKGMDEAVRSYVSRKWCFVAVKARVGALLQVTPRPGMKKTNTRFPAGEQFQGAVQAMGFRFRVKPFVLPMRLASYNGGPLVNEIVCLTDRPIKVDPLPQSMVVRQLSGEALFKNVTELLPYRLNGSRSMVNWKNLAQQALKRAEASRNPEQYNGRARELFAGDLLAARKGRLSHPFEEREKELYLVNEALGLRGPHLDRAVRQSLRSIREKEVADALEDLKKMTLTVLRGDLPRMQIRYQDLTISSHTLVAGVEAPRPLNRPVLVNPPTPRLPQQQFDRFKPQKGQFLTEIGFLIVLTMILVGLHFRRTKRHPMGRSVSTWILLVAFILAASITQNAVADEVRPGVSELCNQLYDAKTAPTAAQALLARGKESLPLLLGIVGERGDDIAARGWAMSILAHHKDTDAVPFLHRSLQDSKEQPIVRLWAARSLLILGHPHLVLRMSQNGQTEITLRNALTTTLSESGPEIGPGLIRVAFDAKRNNVQLSQLATSYLGVATIDSPANRRAYLDRLAGPKSRKQKTWGSVLWIPGVQWTESEARELSRILIDWMKFAQKAQDQNMWTQVRNNLQSVGGRYNMRPDGKNWWSQGADAWEQAWQTRFGGETSNR